MRNALKRLLLPLCAAALICQAPAINTGGATNATPTYSSPEMALASIKQALSSCPETISVRLTSGLNKSLLSQAAGMINSQSGLHCHRATMQGNLLTLSIRYEDAQLILAAHEGKISKQRLTPLQLKLYQKALSIIREAQAGSTSEYELARALHDHIVLNSRYVLQISPDGPLASILLHGKGLCECYARTYELLTRLAGLDCRFVSGRARNTNHAWNIIKLNGTWVHVDCTFDDPVPDKAGKVSHIYFGMSDATIGKGHSWARNNYPACPSDRLWYAYNNMPHFATLDNMVAALIRKANSQGGHASLQGYVEELARNPKPAARLLRAAGQKHRRSLSMESLPEETSAGFITLSTR